MYHVQKLTLNRAISDPDFAKETLSKMPATAFDAQPEYRELYQVIRRYYRTQNRPLDEETFLTLVEDKLTAQGKSEDDLNKHYDAVADLYIVSEEKNEEVVNEQVTKFVRKTMTVNALKDFIASGALEDEEAIEGISNQLKEIAVMNTTTAREGEGIDFFRDVEKKKNLYKNLRKEAFPTGFRALDSILDGGGLGKGEVALLIAPTGTGKAHPNHQKVKTPYGEIAIGNLEVGDDIFGTDGAYKVDGVFPQGKLDVYEVHINDGTIIEVNKEHLWTVKDGEGKFVTLTTEEIMNNLNSEEIDVYELPRIEPVEYPNKELHTLPYLAGAEINPQRYMHIDYLENSSDVRKEIMSGILSNYERRGSSFLLTDISPDFAVDVVELANGLGLHATRYVQGQDVKVIIRDESKSIVGVKKTDRVEEMTCISVTAPDKLYLTTNYTPTHNTTFTIQLTNNAVSQGLNSMFITLEEKLDRLVFRFENNFLGTGGDFFFDEEGNLNEELYERSQEIYKNSNKKFGEFYIEKRNPREVSVEGIEQIISDYMIRSGKELDFVVIDYPALLNMPGDSEDHAVIGEVFERIRAIAQKYNFVCWTLAQTNRTAHQADVITSAHLEGGRKILNASELVVTLNRKPEEYMNGFLRLHIDKVRNPAPEVTIPDEIGFKVNRAGYRIQDLTEDEVIEHNSILREVYKDSASGYELAQGSIDQMNQQLGGN